VARSGAARVRVMVSALGDGGRWTGGGGGRGDGHTSAVNSVAWSPDGATLASASYKEVRLWRVSDGQPLRTLDGHTSAVNSVAWSPDGATLASASYKEVRLWRVSDGALLAVLVVSDRLYGCSWHPRGDVLAVGGAGGVYFLRVVW
jgi:WD40 repeat protein